MLQRFHYRLSSLANKYDIDANRLINELREIEVFLSQYPVAPHLKTNMYSKKWDRYRSIVAAMIKTIETWESGDQSKKDPAVLVENLKNILKIYMVGTKS